MEPPFNRAMQQHLGDDEDGDDDDDGDGDDDDDDIDDGDDDDVDDKHGAPVQSFHVFWLFFVCFKPSR